MEIMVVDNKNSIPKNLKGVLVFIIVGGSPNMGLKSSGPLPQLLTNESGWDMVIPEEEARTHRRHGSPPPPKPYYPPPPSHHYKQKPLPKKRTTVNQPRQSSSQYTHKNHRPDTNYNVHKPKKCRK